MIVVANRLLVSVSKRGSEFHIQPSPGGLVGGLASLSNSMQRLWIGWLGISKGRAVEHLIAQDGWDFLLAAADDYTDEEMFAVLPADAYSIKVGIGASRARFNVDAVRDMRSVLRRLLECHAISLPA